MPPDPPKKPYIVRSIGEQTTDYLLRVESHCQREMEDLLADYRAASIRMELERLTLANL